MKNGGWVVVVVGVGEWSEKGNKECYKFQASYVPVIMHEMITSLVITFMQPEEERC